MDARTALYGHIKISNLKFKVGNKVEAGKVLTYLGDEFSSETSKERKHLHFGIYKGTDIYFKGHEPSRDALYQRWEDPNKYLVEKRAILPNSKDDLTEETMKSKKFNEQKINIWDKLSAWVRKLFLFR